MVESEPGNSKQTSSPGGGHLERGFLLTGMRAGLDSCLAQI